MKLPVQPPAWLPLLALLLLAACHHDSPPAIIDPSRRHAVYDMAWRRGQNDRLTPLPNNWQRYQSKLAPFADVPGRELIFSTGYDDGFNQSPEDQRNDAEMAYDAGYRTGQEDVWQHKPATPPAEPDHAKGYGDGFNHRPHAYGRPY
jgi:hypothetical protein